MLINVHLFVNELCELQYNVQLDVQGGSNMTGSDLCVNKPHYAAAVRP